MAFTKNRKKKENNETQSLNPDQTSLIGQLKKLRVWLIPIVGFVVIMVVSVFVIKPWVEDVFDKRELIKDRKDKVSSLMTKVNQLSRQDSDKLQEYLVSLDVSIPSTALPPVVLATVEQGLMRSGLVIDSIQFTGLEDSQVIEEDVVGGTVDLQLTARGEMTQISEFLKQVHDASPLIVPQEFTVRELDSVVVEEEDGEVSISKGLSFVASAPFQLIPEDLGDSTDLIDGLSSSDEELIEALAKLELLLEIKDPTTQEDDIEKGKENIF